MTVNRTAAVAGGGTLCAVALYNACVAVALAGAGNVDLIAGCEDVCLQNVADVELCRVFELELFKVLEHADAVLLQMAGFGLGDVLLGNFFVTELDGFIAFLFCGHLLGHDAGACLDDGHGDDLAHFVEDLRHADLLADNGFLH